MDIDSANSTKLSRMAESFTILAADKPYAGSCSRCSSAIAGRVVVAIWNDVEFHYCQSCVPTKGNR